MMTSTEISRYTLLIIEVKKAFLSVVTLFM